MNNCDDYKGLLVGLLDGELTPEELRQVNDHLIRCAACRAEYERLRQSSGGLSALAYQEPSDAVLAKMWRSPYSRFARVASLAMVLGGYALLTGYAIFTAVVHGREALPIRLGIAAVAIGFLVLLLQVVWERVRSYRVDPYKEIER